MPLTRTEFGQIQVAITTMPTIKHIVDGRELRFVPEEAVAAVLASHIDGAKVEKTETGASIKA